MFSCLILAALFLGCLDKRDRQMPFQAKLGLHPGMPLILVEDSLRSHGLYTSSVNNAFSVDFESAPTMQPFKGMHLYDSSQSLVGYSLVAGFADFENSIRLYDTIYDLVVKQVGLPDTSQRVVIQEDSANFPDGVMYSLLHARWFVYDVSTDAEVRIDLYLDRRSALIYLLTRVKGWYGDPVLNPSYQLQ